MTQTHQTATTGPEKSIRRYTLLGVFLTIFLDLVGFGMFIPILPTVARELNASDAEAAYLSTLFSLGTLLSVMVLGRISDSLGRRKILLATLLLSVIAQSATALALSLGSYAFLACIRFVAGVAAGNISVAQAAVADITAPHERSRSMVIIGLAFGAGFAVGPAIGAALSALFPESPLKAIAAAAVFLNLANILFLLTRFKETHRKFAPPEIQPLIAAAGANADMAGEQRPTRLELLSLLSRPHLKMVLFIQFLQVFGFVGVETILPLALTDAYSMSQVEVYKAFMFLGIAVLLMNGLISRPLLRKLSESRTLNLGQLCLALGIVLIPWVAPQRDALYGALACLALGSALANPALGGLISRLSPQDRQGLAIGFAQTLSASARILGPAFMGILYQTLGGSRSLYISGALLLVLVVIGMAGLSGLAQARPQHSHSSHGDSP
jgi:DHA1 family tetracycline resistance protein-like MFS transporter